MKKNILISFLLFIAISMKVNAQCKFEEKIDSQTQATFDMLKIPIDKVTIFQWLFGDKKTESIFAMAKNENDYYVVLKFKRSNSKTFDVLKNNSLDFTLSNGEKVQVFPVVDFPHAWRGLVSDMYILCIYRIDKLQLIMLGKNEVETVSFHYTADIELKGSHVDAEGRFSFDYDISKLKICKNASYLSLCILNN